MKPAKIPFTILQGATFRKRLVWKTGTPAAPVDLTGCTARMQMRTEVGAPTAFLTFTTENGRITLGGPTGAIDFYVSDEDTAEVVAEAGVHDLEIVHPSGEVTRLAEGSVRVSPEVTRT